MGTWPAGFARRALGEEDVMMRTISMILAAVAGVAVAGVVMALVVPAAQPRYAGGAAAFVVVACVALAVGAVALLTRGDAPPGD